MFPKVPFMYSKSKMRNEEANGDDIVKGLISSGDDHKECETPETSLSKTALVVHLVDRWV